MKKFPPKPQNSRLSWLTFANNAQIQSSLSSSILTTPTKISPHLLNNRNGNFQEKKAQQAKTYHQPTLEIRKRSVMLFRLLHGTPFQLERPALIFAQTGYFVNRFCTAVQISSCNASRVFCSPFPSTLLNTTHFCS